MVRRFLLLLYFLGLLIVARGESPLEARKNFKTHLLREQAIGEAAEKPPAGVLDLVKYRAPLGDNAAYVSSDPKDGKKHPAIIWLVGGFSNSISDLAWTPGPAKNDQSASGFRNYGIVMMYPSLRGGNDNSGKLETFFGEVDDVLAAAKYLAQVDYVDPTRIYLGGHSTGGTLVLLVAAAADPGRFRAAFALGPVDDVTGYGADILPFDLADSREGRLRMPLRFLNSVQCPTFVFEGSKAPSNIASLRVLAKAATNPLLHFRAIPDGSHFSIIHPLVDEIGASIVGDGKEHNSFVRS